MSQPTCPKCSGKSFEMQDLIEGKNLKGSKYNMKTIICSSCGTIVSVHNWVSVPFLITKLAEKLKINLDD
jgi:uncharacterized Zn finger protein